MAADPTGIASQLIRTHHSVLTAVRIDEPGESTRDAFDQVLAFLVDRLVES